MDAYKHLTCKKCGSTYRTSMGEMTQQDFDDYLADGDRLEQPYIVAECDYCKIYTLHFEHAWELVEPEEE